MKTSRITKNPFKGLLAAGLACLSFAALATAQTSPPPATKTFIDYFLPTPPAGPLSREAWGAPDVGPRDPRNGLEDAAMKQWDYWDGQIIRAKDGKYHLFASRWDQAVGHKGWGHSKAVHAVSDTVTGPYVDKGLCWPDDAGGKGHNVTALTLPDGRYAVVVSETRPGDVFVSDSLDGPWQHLGRIQVAPNEFSALGRMSNVSIMVRPDGGFEIVPRSGAILISKTGILGPYTVQGPSIYPAMDGLPKHDLHNLEDPVVWYSGGSYHIVVNNWSDRGRLSPDLRRRHQRLDLSRRRLRSAPGFRALPGRHGQPLGEDGTPRRAHGKRPRHRPDPGGARRGERQGEGQRRARQQDRRDPPSTARPWTVICKPFPSPSRIDPFSLTDGGSVQRGDARAIGIAFAFQTAAPVRSVGAAGFRCF